MKRPKKLTLKRNQRLVLDLSDPYPFWNRHGFRIDPKTSIITIRGKITDWRHGK
jgi:hypothetical protein